MGKILTYLGIEEAGQTRNILDAERLLEGMQSLYANSPEGKKKDSFAVPLAEMTKTFIEQVKGIKPKEKPKEQQVVDGDEADLLVDWFIDFQQFFMQNEEVTSRIVYDNEEFQKKYILWMQRATISLFESGREEYKKKLKDFLITLNDNENNRQYFLIKLYNKDLEVIEGQTQEFNSDLAANFLALYNVIGKDKKEEFTAAYKVINTNYLNPALFESEMEVTESPDNQGGTSTTLPSFIKPISYDKPSKPQKPSKPSKPSKPKFKIGDKYSIVSDAETTFTIEDVEIDNIKIRYADGSYGIVEIKYAESYVKNRVWKKIEPEFKVGDVYYVELHKQKFTIIEVESESIHIKYDDGTEDRHTLNYSRLMVARKDWVKVVDEEMPEQEQQYKVGDIFITSDNKDLTFKIDFIQPDSIGFIYFDGLTAINTPDEFLKGLKSGYYKPYNEPQEETDLYFKEGDEFIEKKTKNKYIIGKVNKNLDVVKIKIASRDNDGYSEYTIPYVQGLIKKGYWVKKYAKPSRPSKPTSKPTTPTTLSDKDKQIKHILDINIEDIDF